MGARTSAWGCLSETSIDWRIETEKVAVLPVPDWAWAITSWPCGSERGGQGRRDGEEQQVGATHGNDGHDGALLDGRGTLETAQRSE